MPSLSDYRTLPRLLAAACALLLLVTSLASAYGNVTWKTTKLKENEASGGSWKIELTIVLDRAPDLPTVTAKFEFKPTTYFERYKDDAHGDTAVVRRVSTPGKEPIIEGVDMGFLDPSDGKIQKRTKFSFKITRAHGFDAGEYQVTIRDSRNNQIIGRSVRLVLDGENPVIDRRSMVFASGDSKREKEKKKKEEEEKKKKEKEEASGSKPNPEDDEEFWPEVTDQELYGPQHPDGIDEKPGACGCRTAAAPERRSGLGLGLFGLLLVAVLRRRRR